jgi:pyridinium-3,5-bisthiocarboxylic acid mononucleotide nickel chelatase
VTRVAYLDCVGGIAGDMLLAGLLDAGAPEEALRSIPQQLGFSDVEIVVERVERHGVGALHVRVQAPAHDVHRGIGEIRRLIDAAELPGSSAVRALEAFGRLAEIEARIHGVPVESVHFHELGAVDAIVDICGVFALLDRLEVERVLSSPLPYARGLTRAAHGVLPLPAPATLGLLEGVPLVGVATEAELVTPTGAAIASVAVEEWGALPPLVLERVGYGAGSADFPDRPNLLRVVLGRVAAAVGDVVLLETNVDDLSPSWYRTPSNGAWRPALSTCGPYPRR